MFVFAAWTNQDVGNRRVAERRNEVKPQIVRVKIEQKAKHVLLQLRKRQTWGEKSGHTHTHTHTHIHTHTHTMNRIP